MHWSPLRSASNPYPLRILLQPSERYIAQALTCNKITVHWGSDVWWQRISVLGGCLFVVFRERISNFLLLSFSGQRYLRSPVGQLFCCLCTAATPSFSPLGLWSNCVIIMSYWCVGGTGESHPRAKRFLPRWGRCVSSGKHCTNCSRIIAHFLLFDCSLSALYNALELPHF